MADFTPTVVVKLRDDVAVPYVDAVEQSFPGLLGQVWRDDVLPALPFATLNRLFNALEPAEIQRFLDEARATSRVEPHNLLSYFTMPVPEGVDAESVRALVAALPVVEHAEIEVETGVAIVEPAGNPLSAQQRYFAPAPVGVDAHHVWSLPLADGGAVRFVDIEYGWFTGHEDLVNAAVSVIPVRGHPANTYASGVGTLSRRQRNQVAHGTAMLGIVLAADNTLGIVGLTPGVIGGIATAENDAGRGGTNELANALLAVGAAPGIGRGSVVLAELQVAGGGDAGLPIETRRYVAGTILDLTLKGITVIEPAGNGGHNLDQVRDPVFGDSLNRSSNWFFDSGGILVGAGAASAPDHPRLPFSCFGSRVDCYAWGEDVITSWAESDPPGGVSAYLSTGGTSPASAIIAGAAIAVQNLAVSGPHGNWLTPAELRALLGSPVLNTASVSAGGRRFPSPDGTVSILPPEPIGVMPNLRRIADHLAKYV